MSATIEGYRPKIVDVISQVFEVSFTDHLHVDNGEGEIADVIGACDRFTNTIGVLEGLGFDRERETMLHETLHAVWSIAGLTTTLGEVEEDVVKRLSPVLLYVLRRNPDLVRYLVMEL